MVVAGLLVISDLLNITTGFIQNLNGKFYGLDIDPTILTSLDVEGLKKGIAMLNGVYLLVHGLMLVVGIVLLVIGIRLMGQHKVIVKDPAVDVSTTWVWELGAMFAAIVLYVGGYSYLISFFSTMQNING